MDSRIKDDPLSKTAKEESDATPNQRKFKRQESWYEPRKVQKSINMEELEAISAIDPEVKAPLDSEATEDNIGDRDLDNQSELDMDIV